MGTEQLRDQIDDAIKQALASGVDVDDIEETLQDAQNRLEAVRQFDEGTP
jgi:hypothetical protein